MTYAGAVAEAATRQAGGVATLDPDPIELLRSKGWGAVGAFDSTERSFVLDQDPIDRFEVTMDGVDDSTLDGFYSANFAALYRGAVPV